MRHKSPQRVKAEELARKFPKTPTLTLAKMLFKEGDFTSIEKARHMLRDCRGQCGKFHREQTTDKSLYKDDGNVNPWHDFESHIEEPTIFKLPKSVKKVLLIGDLHIPYHDITAIKAAIDYGKKEGVDCVFVNGDMLDFYQLSDYSKDPRKTPLSEELELGRKFFDILNIEFPNAVKYFIPGNHEARLEKYLYVKAPELLGISEFKLDILLKCGEKKINYIPHGSDVYFGKLLVEHGDKLRGSGGVNPARTAMLKFKRSVIVNHFHRTTSSNGNVYKGDNHMAWSVGHLGEQHPKYLPVNEWNQGFAIIEMNGDNYKVNNYQIINGGVY